jgi:hypothetical protein
MIGEKFTDNHPIITHFNSSLNEAYASQDNEEKKQNCILIAEKNLDIARKTYGENSIFALKWELSCASNKIS